MNAILKYPFPLVLAILLASCGAEYREQATDFAELPPFNEIQVNSVFHIILEQDTSFSIRVSGNREIMEGVRFTVENGMLTLTNESRMTWLKPDDHLVELHICADRPKKIIVNETCFIETANPVITDEFGLVTGNKYAEARLELNCNIFYFWNNFPCGGKLTLEGNTQSLRLWNYVIMSVDARNLMTRYAYIENYSQGDCTVNVTEQMDCSIFGIGNVYLYGDPDEIILRERTGTGKLIRME